MTELEWMDSFGDNLKDLMKKTGINQEELAYKTNISQSNISRYINRQNMPSVRAIVNLAYALNCSTDDLIDFFEPID